jgi:Ran GTPase-activating protein (RanGAP) involved in mRNA processing and transport
MSWISADMLMKLSEKYIGKAGVKQLIAIGLANMKALTGLHVGGNYTGSKGAKILARVLPSLTALKAVKNRRNNFRQEGDLKMARALKELATFEVLDADSKLSDVLAAELILSVKKKKMSNTELLAHWWQNGTRSNAVARRKKAGDGRASRKKKQKVAKKAKAIVVSDSDDDNVHDTLDDRNAGTNSVKCGSGLPLSNFLSISTAESPFL